MIMLNATLAGKLIESTAERIVANADELSRLDAIAGDGDHGVNMSTAFIDARRRISDPSIAPASSAEIFRATSTAFSETVGGASGALLGAFFTAVAKGLEGIEDATAAEFVAALQQGTARLHRVSRAELQQKTMIDALMPAVDAAHASSDAGGDLAAALSAAAHGAAVGAAATADMKPAAGRARYAADRSLGNPDPGATTIAHLFAAWAEVINTEVAA